MQTNHLFRFFGVIAPLLVAGCTLLIFESCTPSKANDVPRESLTFAGYFAPSFELTDFTGKPYSSESFNGKYVVLHIATTWCPFCNAEAPHLEKLYRDYRDKNVEVLIIDVKEPRETIQEKLVDRFNLSFPVLLDTDGSVAASFAPKDVLPDLARDEVMLASNIIIDPNGEIQFFSLLDSINFDAELVNLKARLNELL